MWPLNNYRNEWLPHLHNVIPIEARHNRTSLYTIALEGWRRGLTLTFLNKFDEHNQPLFTYRLQYRDKTHDFDESSGDKNTEEAFNICRDKALTSEYLMKANVPIPLGEKFGPETSIEEMINRTKNLTYPLVVKPTDESSGRGVVTNITTKEQLNDALIRLRQHEQYEHIIIQEHVHGDEIRIYVLDDNVIAATNRLPANVIGDGRSTVTQLINEKNQQRKSVPHLYFRPIIIDARLRNVIERQGYTLDTILKKGERLFVREVSNISTGGDPVDVTDQLTDEQRKIAIAATKAIPGLVHCGVDMIVPEDSKSGVILEVNTRPGIGSHLFPIEGKARDIPKELIDFYFPETKTAHESINKNIYFDLQAVFDGINDGHLAEIELKPCPQKPLYAYRWKVSTDRDILHLYESIRKIIIAHEFNGHLKKIDEDTIEIVIAHEHQKAIDRLKTYLVQRGKSLTIKLVEEMEYEKPIKVGFRMIDGHQQMSVIELERLYHENLKEIKRYEQSVQRLRKRITLMENSSSWKLTKPIRYLASRFKK